jgi:hypothetical protein
MTLAAEIQAIRPATVRNLARAVSAHMCGIQHYGNYFSSYTRNRYS